MSASPTTASPSRSRLLRRVMIGFALLVGISVAGAIWIAATFNPNAYKPWLIELVQQRYQRTLTLDGEIRISWFPSIGAEVGGVSLSERASSTEFVGADRLRVSLALLPLLRGRMVVEDLLISRPRITVVERQDGSRNFDDLLKQLDPGEVAAGRAADGAGGAPAIEIDIAAIVIDKGRLTLRSEGTGQAITLSGFDLSTGRLGGSFSEPFTFAAGLQSAEPELDIRAEARGQLMLDVERSRFATAGLVATVAGSYAGAPVDVRVELGRLLVGERVLELDKLLVSARRGDNRAGLSVEARLPALMAKGATFSGANLALVIDRKAAGGALNIRVGAPLQGRLADDGFMPLRVDAPEIRADLEGQVAGKTVQGAARAQFTADIAGARYELSKLAVKGTLFGLDAPVRDVTVTLDGAAVYDLAKEAVSLSVDGRLNESSLRLKIARSGAAAPVVFDAELDQFDLDRYRPVPSTSAGKSTPSAPPSSPRSGGSAPKGGAADAIDFAFLDGLALSGALRVGALKANGIRANNVRVDVKAAGGRLDLDPMVASLYSGRLAGSVSLVNAAPPRVMVRQTLSGVQVGPLLTDAAQLDLIEGRGDIQVDLSTQGRSVDEFKRALAGSASVSLADGALRGVNIAGVLRDARKRLAEIRGREVKPSVSSDRTDFSALKASFRLRDGVASNNDLSMMSPLLRASGEGTLDLGRDNIDYLLRATIVGTLTGQGGRAVADLRGVTVPVRIVGPLAKPGFDFELQAMALDAAHQEVKRRITDLLQERLGGGKPADGAAAGKADAPRPSPADLLKGLFGR